MLTHGGSAVCSHIVYVSTILASCPPYNHMNYADSGANGMLVQLCLW
jgi:hypothetical protein